MDTGSVDDVKKHPPYTHLVIVCCHAVYTGDGKNTSEDQWRLQPFQRSDRTTGKPSETETMIQHIMAGAQHALASTQTLLIFSGGRTTNSPRSEAEGYAKLLLDLPCIGAAPQRYELDNLATDSYQNLLFSILRFRQIADAWPQRITVITHAFKERRFLELHAPAIKWPASRIRIQGINPPFTAEELQATQQGEANRGFAPFVDDPYGVRAPLSEKRIARNWNLSALDELSRHDESEPAILRLLRWEGGVSGKEIFPERLPWEEEIA